jgi:hypothetical protein
VTERPHKIVRSYAVVFRRRWRIFQVQGWRLPLPRGIELRAVGYWLACLALIAALGRLPLLSIAVGAMPASLRLLALPAAAAWALGRWQIDGRSPHRALLALLGWSLRPAVQAGLRRCPRSGTSLPGPAGIAVAADLSAPRYPAGRLVGPARLLLRYPARVRLEGVPQVGEGEERLAGARRWRIEGLAGAPLHRAKLIHVPDGREVIFE